MAEGRRVVLLTAQPDLRTAVARLAALIGAALEVISAGGGARTAWRGGDAVVVGADIAGALAASGLPRRDGVVVVTTAVPDETLWRWSVELGAARVVVLPDDERALLELLGDAVDVPAAGGSAIAVIGGCGGAGASTFAAALALTSSRASRTVLIDGDRLGGGLDVLLGIEAAAGARWPDLAGTRGRLSATALADALPTAAQCAVLSWGRISTGPVDPVAAGEVVDAALRGFDRVVIDLPREGGADLVAAADRLLVIVPATVRATAAAAAVTAGLADRGPRPQLVVRDPGSARLTAAQVSAALGLPVVATLHSEAAVATAAERGAPPSRRGRGSLAAACRQVLERAAEPAAAA
jgi:secretion/DNA translocation related CpaE-like protein